MSGPSAARLALPKGSQPWSCPRLLSPSLRSPPPLPERTGGGAAAHTGARKVISAPGDCSKLGSVSGGWGQRDRCGRRGTLDY